MAGANGLAEVSYRHANQPSPLKPERPLAVRSAP
jgi:hypothetical protein